jgi:uncharacterized protein (DUF1501 family)
MSFPHPTRRGMLQASAAFSAWAMLPRFALAGGRDPRFVFVILRGALDGLAAVPPVGDPDYASLRGHLAFPATGEGAALRLDDTFGLNPNMPSLKAMFDEGHALIAHAVASPYRERSHFDGQDVLENGTAKPNGADTGWLNRAAAAIPTGSIVRGRELFAVGPTVPLVMRGPAPVVSWAPAGLKDTRQDTVMRIARLYGERDPQLLTALTEGEKLDASLNGRNLISSNFIQGGRGERRTFSLAAAAAGRVLAKPDGPRIATLALDGWDTHAKEGPGAGRLGNLLAALDDALVTLQNELGPVWKDTVVAVATEFGRTARENGTEGTDHGTAAASFILGGAVKGGRVLADWPGLKAASLYEGRDLMPTTDLRGLLKGVLKDHLGFPDGVLARDVFPGSESVSAATGLIA